MVIKCELPLPYPEQLRDPVRAVRQSASAAQSERNPREIRGRPRLMKVWWSLQSWGEIFLAFKVGNRQQYRASTRFISRSRGSPAFKLSPSPSDPAIFLSRDARKESHSASVLRNSSRASWTWQYLYQVFIVSSNFSQPSNIIRFRPLYREAGPGYLSGDLLKV